MLLQGWGIGKPDMGNAGSDKNQVSRVKCLHGITYDSLSGSFGNEAQFKFLVIMPLALINVVLKYTYEK
jgi:hypothetical protein